MKIWATIPLDLGPTLIEGLDDIFWERPLFEVRQILLQLFLTTSTNDDGITLLPTQEGMMANPSQRALSLAQIVFLRSGPKDI